MGVKVATQNAHGSNKTNVWTQCNHPEILRYTHNKPEYLKGKNVFCFKAPLFSVLVWFNLVFNVQKFPGCMSGWIRLVHHWNHYSTTKTQSFSVVTSWWNSQLKEILTRMFWLESFYKAQDNRGQLLSSFFLILPSFNWQNPQKSRTCDPNIIHNLIPPLFVQETKGPPKNQSYGPSFVECRFSEFSEHGNHPHLKKIFQVGFKKKTTYFHSYFSSPPVTTCYFSSPPSWFPSTFQKKRFASCFSAKRPVTTGGFFLCPRPRHRTKTQVSSWRCSPAGEAPMFCLVGRLVVEPRLFL